MQQAVPISTLKLLKNAEIYLNALVFLPNLYLWVNISYKHNLTKQLVAIIVFYFITDCNTAVTCDQTCSPAGYCTCPTTGYTKNTNDVQKCTKITCSLSGNLFTKTPSEDSYDVQTVVTVGCITNYYFMGGDSSSPSTKTTTCQDTGGWSPDMTGDDWKCIGEWYFILHETNIKQ